MAVEISREGKKVTLTMVEEDIFNNTKNFKDHREFLQYFFNRAGVRVTQFNNEYFPDGKIKKQGIVVGRTDSDIYPMVTVTVEIGVSAEEFSDDKSK